MNDDGLAPTALKLNNHELSENARNARFDNIRLTWFEMAIKWVLISTGLGFVLLLVIINVYLYRLHNNLMIPNNFWHIPAILAVLLSVVFLGILKMIANFGDRQDHDQLHTLKSIAEIIKQ